MIADGARSERPSIIPGQAIRAARIIGFHGARLVLEDGTVADAPSSRYRPEHGDFLVERNGYVSVWPRRTFEICHVSADDNEQEQCNGHPEPVDVARARPRVRERA